MESAGIPVLFILHGPKPRHLQLACGGLRGHRREGHQSPGPVPGQLRVEQLRALSGQAQGERRAVLSERPPAVLEGGRADVRFLAGLLIDKFL